MSFDDFLISKYLPYKQNFIIKTIFRHARFSIIIFSSMQLNDTKIQEFGRNDGIRTVFHCQDKFFMLSILSVQKIQFLGIELASFLDNKIQTIFKNVFCFFVDKWRFPTFSKSPR